MKIFPTQVIPGVFLVLAAAGLPCIAADKPAAEVPHILLDKSPRIVAYELHRLSNAELVLVERKPDQLKYRPVYEAILTRKGLEKKFRDEAVTALAAIDKSSPVVEILDAIGKTNPDDRSTPRELSSMLLAQKPAALAAQRSKIESMASDSDSDVVKEAAYAALAVADGKPDQAWKLAASKDSLKELIAGIPLINDRGLRAAFYPLVNPLVSTGKDEPTRLAAIETISTIPGHDADTFKELAGIISSGSGATRDAAVRSIRGIKSDNWPTDQIEPLANAVLAMIKATPAADRTGPATGQAVQLGNDLSQELDDAKGQAIRKELRELAVPVIVIRTLREQMEFDTKYFVVQAGKPIEVILENGDAMPHNLVITTPGAMQEVAVAAGQMPPPGDDTTTAYIPKTPKVLAALSMVQPDESKTMTFTAPKEPGEYDFVCTFPGHWVRMYGVMLVVPDLDAWEKNPVAPHDPLSHKTYDAQKNQSNIEGGNQ